MVSYRLEEGNISFTKGYTVIETREIRESSPLNESGQVFIPL
jgi:hypothetical protein